MKSHSLLVFGMVHLVQVQQPNEVVLIGLVPQDPESLFFALSHSLRNTPPYFIEALSKWLNWSNHSLDWSEPCIFFMANPLDNDIVFCSCESCESSLLRYCDKSGPGAWQGCLYSRPLNFETFQCLQKQKRCQCCHWSHCWLDLQL